MSSNRSYFTQDDHGVYSEIVAFSHPEKEIDAILVPFSNVGSPSYYNAIQKMIYDQTTFFDLQIANHPYFLNLNKLLLNVPNYEQIIAFYQNSAIIRNNNTIIKQILANHLFPPNQKFQEQAKEIMAQPQYEKFALLYKIAEINGYEPSNLLLLQRYLAELLECTLAMKQFDLTTNPKWSFVPLSVPGLENPEEYRMELNKQSIFQINQLAADFLQSFISFSKFAQIPQLFARRKAYGQFLLRIDDYINQHIEKIIPEALSMVPYGQALTQFLDQDRPKETKIYLLFGGISYIVVEHELLIRGYKRVESSDKIMILPYSVEK